MKHIHNFNSSKHVIIVNELDYHHFHCHLLPLIYELQLQDKIRYGLTVYKNLLFWIYSSVGAPSPHVSFETKTIFSVIDYISKQFWKDEFSSSLQNEAIIINELWNEIYLLKKHLYDLTNKKDKTNTNCIEFIAIDDLKLPKINYILDIKSFKLFKNNSKFHYYKITIYNHSINNIYIEKKNIKTTNKKFNIVLFDFTNNKNIKKYIVTDNNDINIKFYINSTNDIGLCIYSGLQGSTNGELFINDLKHYYYIMN